LNTGGSLQHSGGSPQQQQLRDEASSSIHNAADAMGADAMQVDEIGSTRQGIGNSSSSSRKRPAVGEPAAAESESAAAGVSSQEGATGASPGCRVKQPRMQDNAAGAVRGQQTAAGQARSSWGDQQQQVRVPTPSSSWCSQCM
jgi:hypothetical protein